MALATDLVVLVLPVVFVWPQHMSTVQKRRTISLLAMGGVAVGMAVYRVCRFATFKERSDFVCDMTNLDLGV